ncbi:MAG TPA: hypothetical protein ENG63_09685 [Candidatus Desulfofervidus auxilii]|uniref:Uncharacterized protein n=1 Tax=Desulfofervidus auxilii TaxID=1621989 RepID=A0A7C0YAQ4_DESA2|nr:hypothetical protein [Candidatus Desulfofervidus auxilii]
MRVKEISVYHTLDGVNFFLRIELAKNIKVVKAKDYQAIKGYLSEDIRFLNGEVSKSDIAIIATKIDNVEKAQQVVNEVNDLIFTIQDLENDLLKLHETVINYIQTKLRGLFEQYQEDDDDDC